MCSSEKQTNCQNEIHVSLNLRVRSTCVQFSRAKCAPDPNRAYWLVVNNRVMMNSDQKVYN